ncbi:MAG: hypothetical protein FWG05_03310 [Kiritimatiellaeota bacterium]|nr:hypothetical protein [Kiritimatiellota bacterium]
MATNVKSKKLVFALLVLLALSCAARAANTWTGGVSRVWDDARNWADGEAPMPTKSAEFIFDSSDGAAFHFETLFEFASLAATTNAGQFTINAPSIRIGASTSDDTDDGWILEEVVMPGEVVNKSAHPLVFNGATTLAHDTTFDAQGAAISFTGGLDGGKAFVKKGPADMTISGGKIAFSSFALDDGRFAIGGAKSQNNAVFDYAGNAINISTKGYFEIGNGAIASNCTLHAVGGATPEGRARVRVSDGGKLWTHGFTLAGAGMSNVLIVVSGEGASWVCGGKFTIGATPQFNAPPINNNGVIAENGGVIQFSGTAFLYTEYFQHIWTFPESGGNFLVADGGTLSFAGPLDFITGYGNATHPYFFRNNHVRAGGTRDKPGLVAMNGNDINIAHHNDGNKFLVENFIEAAAFGKFTGARWIRVGFPAANVTNNFVRTSGGEIGCANLIVYAGNGLAPVVTAAHGTGKITVSGRADFAAGTFIKPSAEPGAAPGEYEILSGRINGKNNISLVTDPDENANWELVVNDNSILLRYNP